MSAPPCILHSHHLKDWGAIEGPSSVACSQPSANLLASRRYIPFHSCPHFLTRLILPAIYIRLQRLYRTRVEQDPPVRARRRQLRGPICQERIYVAGSAESPWGCLTGTDGAWYVHPVGLVTCGDAYAFAPDMLVSLPKETASRPPVGLAHARGPQPSVERLLQEVRQIASASSYLGRSTAQWERCKC